MRDLLILGIFCAGALVALQRPFVGVLLFFWISFMNPHRYAWGFTYDLPLAMMAAAVTLASLVLHLKDARFPNVRETWLFLMFWGFFTLTTVTSFYPNLAWPYWDTANKIFLMTLVATVLITTRTRLMVFLLAVIVYVGSIGIKGATFGLLTRGQYRVWGPPESFMADNNAVGLAMVMIAPLCFFLRDSFPKRWQSRVSLGVGLSAVVTAALTYSRGALVGLLAIGFFMFLASKKKLRILVGVVVIGAIGINFLPESWFDRMGTIETYDEDRSANMRLNSWAMSFNLARDNLLGGGFNCFTMEQYYKYAPDPELGRTMAGGSTAHSIYFEVMATQGFIGLAIFLACMFSMLVSLRRIDRRARDDPDPGWVSGYSRALSVSIIGFMVCGAFQSKAFFDLFWAIYGSAIAFKNVVLVPQPVTARLPSPIEPRSAPQPLSR